MSPPSQVARRIKGKNVPVKGVPCRIIDSVGRHTCWHSDDLYEMLQTAGVVDPVCRKLILKDGKLYKTTASVSSGIFTMSQPGRRKVK